MNKLFYSCIALAGLAAIYLYASFSPPANHHLRQSSSAADSVDQVADPGWSSNGNEIPNAGEEQSSAAAIEARLEPIDAPVVDRQAILWGILQSEGGDVVSGEEIKLYAPSLETLHATISNDHGEFVIDGIAPAEDYQLSIMPHGMYQRYEHKLTINENQTDIKIVLKKLQVGPLTGRIVDVNGVAVPGFNILLRSALKPRWSVNVTGDENARFEVPAVPLGELEITSTSDQLLKITGLNLAANPDTSLDAVIDAGPYSVSGRVYDRFNAPVAGAYVVLSWVYTRGTVRSAATRRTITKTNGEFRIEGVGEGVHNLIVSSTGEFYRRDIDVGSDSGYVVAVLNLGE